MTDDRDLLAELAALLRRVDPVPDDVRALAQAVFDLAFVPPEWTRLDPVAEPLLVRAGRRSFRFAAGEISVGVDLRGPSLVGLVHPVMEVEVHWLTGSRRVRPDAYGLFRLDDVPRGPLRVLVGQTHVTRWFWP
jgi:hypothetical protein